MVSSGGSLPGTQVHTFQLALKVSQVPQNLVLQFKKLIHPLFIIISHQISKLVSDLKKEKVGSFKFEELYNNVMEGNTMRQIKGRAPIEILKLNLRFF